MRPRWTRPNTRPDALKKSTITSAAAKSHRRRPHHHLRDRRDVRNRRQPGRERISSDTAISCRAARASASPAAAEITGECRQRGDDERLVVNLGPKPRCARIDSLNKPIPDATSP